MFEGRQYSLSVQVPTDVGAQYVLKQLTGNASQWHSPVILWLASRSFLEYWWEPGFRPNLRELARGKALTEEAGQHWSQFGGELS